MPKKRTWILSALLLLAVSQSAWCLALSDLETQIRRNIRDTATSSSLQRYSDTVLDAYINEVQRDVVNLTTPLSNRASFTLTARTTYYSCPTDMIVPLAVYYTNQQQQVYELQEKLETSYRQNNPTYEHQIGPPTIYFIRGSTSTNVTQAQIAFIPVANNTSTGTVTMDYYNIAADLSADSDIPFDGLRVLYPYHDVIVYGVTAKIKLREGDTNGASSYFEMYKDMVNRMGSKLGEAPNYHPSIIAGPSR